MLIGVPLLKDRIAPRCTIADSILIVSLKYNILRIVNRVHLHENTSIDLESALRSQHVNTLICGGISQTTRQELESLDLEIVENVTGTKNEILNALSTGKLKSGYGFNDQYKESTEYHYGSNGVNLTQSNGENTEGSANPTNLNCLTCVDKICLQGKDCTNSTNIPGRKLGNEFVKTLDAAFDIAFEEERRLCRIAELVYYCLEMKYNKIGIAYCVDLTQPTKILSELLTRFFSVHSVCCKIGGIRVDDENFEKTTDNQTNKDIQIACNPELQAEVLNRIGTDLNVLIGLCMGVDTVFSMASHAPVTTLFVKDKSLANNPIGAIYSDYYINDIQ